MIPQSVLDFWEMRLPAEGDSEALRARLRAMGSAGHPCWRPLPSVMADVMRVHLGYFLERMPDDFSPPESQHGQSAACRGLSAFPAQFHAGAEPVQPSFAGARRGPAHRQCLSASGCRAGRRLRPGGAAPFLSPDPAGTAPLPHGPRTGAHFHGPHALPSAPVGHGGHLSAKRRGHLLSHGQFLHQRALQSAARRRGPCRGRGAAPRSTSPIPARIPRPRA